MNRENDSDLPSVPLMSFFVIFSFTKCVTSFVALLIIVEMICRRRLHLYNEIHILLYAKVFFLILFCIESTAAMGIPVVDRLWNPTDPYKWNHTMSFCSPILFVHVFVQFALPTTILAFSIERTLVQLLYLNAEQSARISKTLLFCTVSASSVVVAFSFSYERNWETEVPHCYNQGRGNKAGFWSAIISGFGDLIALSLFIFLKYSAQNVLRTQNLTLEKAFQTRYSLLLVSTFLPVCIFHSFTLLSYIVGMQVVVKLWTMDIIPFLTMDDLFSIVNILPFYALIFPIVLSVVLRKLKRKQSEHFKQSMCPRSKNGDVLSESSVYFENFEKQWQMRINRVE